MPSAKSFWKRPSAAVRKTAPLLRGALAAVRGDWSAHQDHRFRAPLDLRASELAPMNLLMTGSCFLEGLQAALKVQGHRSRLILQAHGSRLPDIAEDELRGYDLQVVQIPTRGVLSDRIMMPLGYDDIESHRAAFEHSRELLELLADAALEYNARYGLPVLFCNFLRPQQNPLGRLLPKTDIRNITHYIDQLNHLIYEKISGYKNVYVLDVDEISAGLGRMHHQDDALWSIGHGSLLSDFDHDLDRDRIHRPTPMDDIYAPRTPAFMQAVIAEIEAMHRTLRQVDAVKMVVTDLDDTLWRGLAGETGRIGELEGWPLGYAEALAVLRQRGVLLGVISKNDEGRILGLWDDYFHGRLKLDDFVARRINWRPKPENMAELLEATNLLPRTVVFIDDNPIERAAMTAAYPDIRTLGAEPYLLRRILLWSPETQVASISTEAAHRTQTTLANIERSGDRKTMSRESFLASLDLKVRAFAIASTADRRFDRCFELLNRTNQFNTTGRRWSAPEVEALFARGGTLIAFEVQDRFSAYGLTGLSVLDGATIVQMVMSCRVFGLEVERAMLHETCRRLAEAGAATVSALLVETDANMPCRSLYAEAGFTAAEGAWVRADGGAPASPAHIALAN